MSEHKPTGKNIPDPVPLSKEDPGFYIGWQPEAPKAFIRHVKKVLIAAGAGVVVAGVALALSQKKFGTGTFEFGQLTTIRGTYFHKPVPNIKVLHGKDIFGNSSYITIPLVGYGKAGAQGIIRDIEGEQHNTIDSKEITLKGTLLYNDGKTLMQIDANDKPVVNIGGLAIKEVLPQSKDLGILTIKGEIVDPKCFFGVMKPGEGKPHKDCAIRCILGGIPPVFRVRNALGENNYYLLASASREGISSMVKDHVAEPVTITARAVQYDDWVVLYLSEKENIASYSYIKAHLGQQLLSCR